MFIEPVNSTRHWGWRLKASRSLPILPIASEGVGHFYFTKMKSWNDSCLFSLEIALAVRLSVIDWWTSLLLCTWKIKTTFNTVSRAKFEKKKKKKKKKKKREKYSILFAACARNLTFMVFWGNQAVCMPTQTDTIFFFYTSTFQISAFVLTWRSGKSTLSARSGGMVTPRESALTVHSGRKIPFCTRRIEPVWLLRLALLSDALPSKLSRPLSVTVSAPNPPPPPPQPPPSPFPISLSLSLWSVLLLMAECCWYKMQRWNTLWALTN